MAGVPLRRARITLRATVLFLVVLLLASAVAFRARWVEEWHVFRLRSGDRAARRRAAAFLVERDAVHALPELFEEVVREHRRVEREADLPHDGVVVSWLEVAARRLVPGDPPYLLGELRSGHGCRAAIAARLLGARGAGTAAVVAALERARAAGEEPVGTSAGRALRDITGRSTVPEPPRRASPGLRSDGGSTDLGPGGEPVAPHAELTLPPAPPVVPSGILPEPARRPAEGLEREGGAADVPRLPSSRRTPDGEPQRGVDAPP